MGVEFKQERKELPCGCISTKMVDMFPYFRFIKYCEAHAKEHGKDVDVETAFIDNSPTFVETEADIERVANYLKQGHVGNADEISGALGMKGIIVVLSLQKLVKKGVVGITPHYPHKFYFNP